MVRRQIASAFIRWARKTGNALGCELVVEVNDHSIKTTMEVPSSDKRAWDTNLYHKGQLFREGYANPIKPVEMLEESDEEEDDTVTKSVQILDSQADASPGKIGMLPSWRYQVHQDQHAISELVNPTEQWRLIVYGIIALGIIGFMNAILILYGTGAF